MSENDRTNNFSPRLPPKMYADQILTGHILNRSLLDIPEYRAAFAQLLEERIGWTRELKPIQMRPSQCVAKSNTRPHISPQIGRDFGFDKRYSTPRTWEMLYLWCCPPFFFITLSVLHIAYFYLWAMILGPVWIFLLFRTWAYINRRAGYSEALDDVVKLQAFHGAFVDRYNYELEDRFDTAIARLRSTVSWTYWGNYTPDKNQ